jgi:hypothetical protein
VRAAAEFLGASESQIEAIGKPMTSYASPQIKKSYWTMFNPRHDAPDKTDIMTDYFTAKPWTVPAKYVPYVTALIASTLQRNGIALSAEGKAALQAPATGTASGVSVPTSTLDADVKIVQHTDGTLIAMGDTFPAKETIKEYGFKWSGNKGTKFGIPNKVWYLPKSNTLALEAVSEKAIEVVGALIAAGFSAATDVGAPSVEALADQIVGTAPTPAPKPAPAAPKPVPPTAASTPFSVGDQVTTIADALSLPKGSSGFSNEEGDDGDFVTWTVEAAEGDASRIKFSDPEGMLWFVANEATIAEFGLESQAAMGVVDNAEESDLPGGPWEVDYIGFGESAPAPTPTPKPAPAAPKPVVDAAEYPILANWSIRPDTRWEQAFPVIQGDTINLAYDKPKPGGSTSGGIYKQEGPGTRFLVKFQTPERAASEAFAAALYRAVGVWAPDVRVFKVGGKWATVAPWEGDLTTAKAILTSAQKNVESWSNLRAWLAASFLADAWLANWDVVGAEYDNLVVKDGDLSMTAPASLSSSTVLNPWVRLLARIDVGGSLAYRAQGAKKPASQWTNSASRSKRCSTT